MPKEFLYSIEVWQVEHNDKLYKVESIYHAEGTEDIVVKYPSGRQVKNVDLEDEILDIFYNQPR